MEKKYYFRGFGLGIIVTAVIMGISLSGGGKKRELTDDEVIARAKELGMIENSNLLESFGEDEEEGEAAEEQETEEAKAPVKKDVAVAAKQEGQSAGNEQESPVQTVGKQDTQGQAEEKPVVGTPEPASEKETVKPPEPAASGQEKPRADTNEMTKQDEDVPKPVTDKTASVTIVSGDGSYTVAKKLAEAGVVSSADSYDDFLCQNGYDKKLRTGTFQIPADADDEQIARIVTGLE